MTAHIEQHPRHGVELRFPSYVKARRCHLANKAIAERLRHVHASEADARRARSIARHAIEDDNASEGWAIQLANRFLSRACRCGRVDMGGAA